MKRLEFLIFAALLSLGSSAFAQPAAEIVHYNNPDISVEVATGLWGIPVPMDYDRDGVKDVVVVCPDTPYKGVYFFRNIGSGAKPYFDKAVKLGGSTDKNLRFSEWEGKTHIFIPGFELNNPFTALQSASDGNNQSAGTPKAGTESTKIEYEGEVLGATYKKCRSNMWNAVDWDGDGDLDIVVGIDTWDDYGWDNAYDKDGNWTNGPLHGYVYILENVDGKYVNRGKLEAGGKIIDTYGAPIPCVADFDGDGDLDIICGEFVDGLTWFENTGTRTAPVFAAGRQLVDKKGRDVRFHVEMIVPVTTDFDGDGRADLVVGDEDGTVSYLHNSGKVKNHMPVFDDQVHFMQKADVVKFGALSTPCSYDWNGDGLEDIITGNSAGEIAFIENLGAACPNTTQANICDACAICGGKPMWAAPKLFKVGKKTLRIMAGENGSIQGPAERKWGYTVLTVADWDADGKADIIVNSIWGKIQWYRNAGAKDGLTLESVRDIKVDWPSEAPKPKWNWWDPAPGTLTSQWRTTPVAIDWNKDGILDLVMLDHEGYLAFFEGFVRDGEHILKPGARIFACKNGCVYNNRKGITDKTPGILRLNDLEAGQSGRRKICLTDWDKDGKLDLIIDGRNGANWFRQMNTTKKGIVNFFYMGALSSTRLEGHTTNPTPVDWNGDGISELLVGAEDGHFYYIPNTMNPQMTIKLYPEGNPSSNGLENTPETIDEKGYVWNISEPRLLVYLPEKDVKPSKAVLVVPGGGYEKCCVTFEGYKTAQYLTSRGIAAFVLEYRLPGGHPQTVLEDGEQAMRIIRSRADEFGIDPGDIGIMGFSAGGHFAATLLTKYTCAQTRPDYGILVYPVISAKYECVGTMDKLLAEAINDPLAAASWSCENNVNSDTPPTMLILCSDDTSVDPAHSMDFYKALLASGVKSQLHILSNGGHGFWMRDRFRYDTGTYHNMTDWIRNWNR